MGAKKRVTINTKITEEEFAKLNRIADRENLSTTAILKLLITGLLNNDIELEKGELKMNQPEEIGIVEEFDTPFGLRAEKKFDVLREREYPDKIIYQMKEEILNGIESRISMMPKKYNARMMRDSDCGC